MIEIENCEEIEDSDEPSYESFSTIDIKHEYDFFFRHFMVKNKPCVFSNFLTSNWSARKDWITEEGLPNTVYFAQQFGKILIK